MIVVILYLAALWFIKEDQIQKCLAGSAAVVAGPAGCREVMEGREGKRRMEGVRDEQRR